MKTIITVTKESFARSEAGKRWQQVAHEVYEITEQELTNFEESFEYFKTLSSHEEMKFAISPLGERVSKIVSVSPESTNKIVYTFDIKKEKSVDNE